MSAAHRGSPVYRIGRDDERTDVVVAIGWRVAAAKGLATKGRITRCEERRLCRWLLTLIGDIEAGVHEPD